MDSEKVAKKFSRAVDGPRERPFRTAAGGRVAGLVAAVRGTPAARRAWRLLP